jgi:hypothetical protein
VSSSKENQVETMIANQTYEPAHFACPHLFLSLALPPAARA